MPIAKPKTGFDSALAALAQLVPTAATTRSPADGAHAPAPQPPSPVPWPEAALSAASGWLDGGDRAVQLLLSLRQPPLLLLGGLLSDEECTGLIELARPRLQRSLTVQVDTGGEALNADRTSQGMFFARAENPLIERIEARIAKLFGWPASHGEGLQVLRYGVGAEYKPHYDYFDPAHSGTPALLRRGGQRVGTLIVYLNQPERGGATTFPDVGLEVLPQRGHAVFFGYAQAHPSSRTLHAGAPVWAGEKWVATKWLREREFV